MDLASGDVTYTVFSHRRVPGSQGGRSVNVVQIDFGNGSLDYPTGGIPLTKIGLGCDHFIESVILVDADSGTSIEPKYDLTNNKFRLYVGTTGIEVSGAVA